MSSREVYNERIIYTEAIFQAVATAGAMSYLSIFLVRLGAPSWLVGLYTSLPSLVMILAVLPVGTFVQRQKNLVATANWGRMIFRTVIGAFALLPLLPPTVAPYIMVAARSLISIPGSAVNIAVTTIWGKATTPERRPRMLSTRMAVMGIFTAILGFLAGQWLDFAPYPLNYQLLFLTAFFAGVGSVLTLSRLKLPEVSDEEIAGQKRVGVRDVLPLIRSVPAFRNFAIAAFIFRFGMSMPMALFPIYRVRVLGATDAWIGVLFTVQRVLSVGTYFTLGRLLAKPGFRNRLWLAALGMALFPLTTALATNTTMLLIPAVVGGLIAPGMNIFLTDTLIRVSPEDQRPAFVAMNSFLANMTAFVSPMIGTLLADLLGIRIALVIAAAVRFVGGLFFWRLGVGTDRES
ncbi:MAG: MFS transporter [Anaerolineae bacterium]|nr:MFS transporter [Anaerolineae bacterium]